MTALTPRALLLASVTALATFPALAQETGPDTRQREPYQLGAAVSGLSGDDAPVPFYRGLAGRPFPVTTASTQAQAYFSQGMALAWGFNHSQSTLLDADFMSHGVGNDRQSGAASTQEPHTTASIHHSRLLSQ